MLRRAAKPSRHCKPLGSNVRSHNRRRRFRRQGLGRKLVSRLIERGRELGCTEAWVATELGNKPARALYEALGGIPDEEHAVVYVYPLRTKPGPRRNNGDA
jgi:aminoglycoside 6'-N-acetyltransferase I